MLGHRAPRVEHLAELRYLEQILKESLRLWPTAPAFALRCRATTTRSSAAATRSAARDTLLVLIPMLHRDPAVWGDDARSSDPERFAPEAPEKLPPNAWKPFGNGQRALHRRGRSRCRRRSS